MDFPEEENVLKFPNGFRSALHGKTDSTETAFGTPRDPSDKNNNKCLNSTILEIPSPREEGLKYDSRHLKHLEYRLVFWQEHGCDKLVEKFRLEKKELVKSGMSHLSYSLENCIERAEKGFFVFKYNFNRPNKHVVKFRVFDYFVELAQNGKRTKRMPIKSFHGIIYGAISSTFKNFKRQVDRREGKVHKFCHCFSIVTEFRTYDFATIKDSDRLDLSITLSYYISLNSQVPTSIPFTKSSIYVGYLTLKTINYKIRSAARKKYMSTVELFMVMNNQLAIIITLKELDRVEEMEKIKRLLDLHFSGLSKFVRFIVRSVLPFIKYFDEEDNNHNYFRINILLGKRLNFLKSQIDKSSTHLVLAPKYGKSYAYLVPSSKSVFQTNRNEDPAFDLIRQRTSKATRVPRSTTIQDGLF